MFRPRTLCLLFLAGCAGHSPEPSAPGEAAVSTATAEVAPSASPEKAAPAANDETKGAPELLGETADDGKPRIGSIRFRTWIWGEPLRSKQRLAIGSLRIGSTVRLKSSEPVAGTGCNDKWYAVEPRGFVCADDTTTRAFESDYWKALVEQRPKKGPWPFRYAFSTGAPMYSRLPSADEQKSAEHDMGAVSTFQTLGKWSEGHEKLITTSKADSFASDGPTPWFFRGRDKIPGSPWNPAQAKVKIIPAGSGFAYTRVFEAESRLWLLTPDLFLVPADRAFPYKRSSFHGLELKDGASLPVAWVRADEGAPRLERSGATYSEKAGASFPGKRPVFLTGQHEKNGKVDLWETKDGGFIADDDRVSVVVGATQLKHELQSGDRWIEASILGGTLVAYEGLVPKFTTMWSPGLGGVGVKGNSSKKYATTEVGIFPIQWKDAVETMSPDEGAPTVFWFADVPHIQYVHAPMAMHVAFWHESFGYPMSAECLNVSPEDGDWLFGFTLPELPAGWGGVGSSKLNGPTSRVNIVP